MSQIYNYVSGTFLCAHPANLTIINLYTDKKRSYFIIQLLLIHTNTYIHNMPLNYQLLEKKSTMEVKDRTGLSSNKVKALDLLSKTYNDNIDVSVGLTFIEVTHEYIGRPDLVSLAVYGDEEYTDILCKFNSISNPFELNEGMILWCPRHDIMEVLSDRIDDGIGNGIISEDEQIIENNTSKTNNKKLLSDNRSPNEATIVDHNYIITDDNQYIIY